MNIYIYIYIYIYHVVINIHKYNNLHYVLCGNKIIYITIYDVISTHILYQ